MAKGRARLGVALLVAGFGCGGSNSAAPDAGITGGAGVGKPTAGNRGAGGSSAIPTTGSAPGSTGAAGSGPVATGAAGANVGAAGAAGTSAGAAGAAGTSAGAAGAAGTSAGAAAACAGDPLTRCPGTMSGAWCTEMISAGAAPSFSSLWANRPDDVWFVGGQFPPNADPTVFPVAFGMLAHFDGCSWTVMQRPDLPQLSGVWGAATNDVWMAGATGSAYHWNGSTLTAVPVPGATSLKSVNGTSSTDVWAVGTGIFHWNGSAWAESSPSTGDDVWAVGANNVWVASGATDALHFDGTTWTGTPLTDFGLFSIWADATQAYAGGEGEALFRFAGGTWTKLQGRGGSSQGFIDIGGFGADIFTVGDSDVVRLSGTTFTRVTDAPPGSFQSVWVSPTQVWLGEPNGAVARRSR